jgi:Putative zinc-finger
MRECIAEAVLQSFCDGELSDAQSDNVTAHLAHCTSCSALLEELVMQNELVSTALAPEFEAAVPSERLRQRIDNAIADIHVVNAANQRPLLGRVNNWFGSLGALFTLGQPQAIGYAALVAVIALAGVFGVLRFQNTEVPKQVAVINDPKSKPATPAPTASPNTTPKEENPPAPDVKSGTERRQPNKASRPRVRPGANEAVAKIKLLPGERTYLRTIAALDSTIKSENDRPMRPALRAEYERNLALVDRALAAARHAAKKNPNDPDAAEFVFAAYQSKVDLMNTVADARVYNRGQ